MADTTRLAPSPSREAWAEVERLIDRFEEAWLQGRRPGIDDHLPADPSQRGAALVELVHVDMEWRSKSGDPFSLEEYLGRYPELGRDPGVLAELREAESALRQQAPASGGEAGNSSQRDPQATMPLTAGGAAEVRLHLPGYEVCEELGRGGMGVVYKARQLSLNRWVALKMIRAASASAEELARFRGEAEVIARLQHSNIVQIHEIGEADGTPYLALEYVEGGSLETRLRDGPLPPRQAAELIQTLARAVHHAHQQGVVHRDLKPANILLQKDEGGRMKDESRQGSSASSFILHPSSFLPKITDFGLAKRIDLAGQTASGSVMGTPSYMAPEQAAGRSKDIGPAADVYSLGAILYECLTGRPPFKGASVLETLDQVRSQEPVPPTRLQPRVPRDLETVCLKCLAKEPRRRYASATALADDLAHFLDGRPVLARPVSVWARAVRWARRRPAVAGLLALVAVVALLGVAGIAWQWRQTAAGLARAEQNLYAQRIALADREFLANRCDQTERILDDCPPALRGWEWHLLKRFCHRDLVSLSLGPAMQVAVSPDPQSPALAAATTRGNVEIYDRESGQRLRTLAGLGPAVTFSPDGKLLASAVWKLGEFGELPPEYDCPVVVLEAATGREVYRLKGHKGTVFSLAFSRNGKLLASGSLDGTVRLWRFPAQASGEPVWQRTLSGHTGWVEAVAFDPEGRLLASAATDGTVKVWDVASGTEALRLRDEAGTSSSARGRITSDKGGARGSEDSDPSGLTRRLKVWNAASHQAILPLRGQTHTLASVCFAPDGSSIAAGQGNNVKVWDVGDGKERLTLRGHTDLVRCLSFHPNGSRLASGSYDHAVKLWDLKTGEEVFTLRGHADAVNGLAFTPDGGRLASGSWDGSVRLWDAERGGEPLTWRAHNDYVRGLDFSPDGATLATASADRSVKRWFASSGQLAQTLHGPEQAANSVAFDPTGQALVAAGYDGRLALWDVPAEQPAYLSGHEGKVYQAVFSPDGRQLASAGEDETVRLWDRQSKEEVRCLRGHAGRVFTLAYAPRGEWLASAGDGGEIIVWDPATGSRRQTLHGHRGDVTRLAVSRDGRLASAGLDRTVRLWDVPTGREVLVLHGHTDAVTSLAFSADGRRVATGGLDRTVRIWEARTGQELLSLRGHGSEVLVLAFSADGWRLAAATVEGTVHVWDATP